MKYNLSVINPLNHSFLARWTVGLPVKRSCGKFCTRRRSYRTTSWDGPRSSSRTSRNYIWRRSETGSLRRRSSFYRFILVHLNWQISSWILPPLYLTALTTPHYTLLQLPRHLHATTCTPVVLLAPNCTDLSSVHPGCNQRVVLSEEVPAAEGSCCDHPEELEELQGQEGVSRTQEGDPEDTGYHQVNTPDK